MLFVSRAHAGMSTASAAAEGQGFWFLYPKFLHLEISAPKSQVMSACVRDAETKISEFEIALSVATLESNTKVILNH